jgi:hypothetical protein
MKNKHQPFARAQAFLVAHGPCPGRVEYFVWLPRGSHHTTITMKCRGCGERVSIPCTRFEGQAVVAASVANGIHVTASDAVAGVH